ncbi:MAG: valine--tRNA ligase [Armatimonadota bacterium]|nr:valine--tRNA ligase [Armatimonadota bacterium]
MLDPKSLPTVYDPKNVEQKWYSFWLEKRYFHAEVDFSRPRYCITIPPPNVTGSLHIGHALCYTIQDVLTRWKRMQGYNTLCLPGTDHAGIATQNKVEQQLAEEGLTRHDLGREEFLKRVWAWKEKYGNEIINQFKRMGFSFDWDRERFTMDDEYVDAVLEAFVRLFNKGYIYRGTRVINWCPRCHTAISDIEVEYVEQPSHLWYIRYPFEDGSGYIVVATTRPETMLGDTAVAVNPSDQRYKDAIGKTVRLPLVGRLIPVIADEFVDPEFGTGAVKVTPAHDPNDFEIGLRHNLPQVVVISPQALMTSEAGERYKGLDRFSARERVVEDLKAQGLLESVEDYTHSVGTCARCDTIIEPLLSEQWFCRMSELAKPAIEVVRDGSIKFYPERYARAYIEWLENVRDWCISRQLWWGHRIPVWKCSDCGEYTSSKHVVDTCSKCGSTRVVQEEDVLDTWFSSALWPFATLGWPKQTPELEYFYPTDVLVTARDIIYLWVARMVFSSLEYLGKIPFRDVYIYATVLNEEGKRMSKSLGTGVDPLEAIDQYGADALRFALIQQTGKTQDIRFSNKRVELARNFANKIWNASRFVIMNLEGWEHTELKAVVDSGLSLEDKWILSRLTGTIRTVNAALSSYDMDDAARALYEFIWSEFCDWYVEFAKPRLRGEAEQKRTVQTVLYHVLETTLRLLHPIMPFITEEIWQALPHEGESIMVAPFPAPDDSLVDESAERIMGLVMEGVRAQRDLKASAGIPLRKSIDIMYQPVLPDLRTYQVQTLLERGAGTALSYIDTPPPDSASCLVQTVPDVGVFYLRVPEVDREKERARITAELESVKRDLARSQAKLANEQFLSRAPAHVVEKERRIAAELAEKAAKLEEQLAVLGS